MPAAGTGLPTAAGRRMRISLPSSRRGSAHLQAPSTEEPPCWRAPTVLNHFWGGRCRLTTSSPGLDLLPRLFQQGSGLSPCCWVTKLASQLSFSISRSLLRLLSIEFMVPSNHFILNPLLLPSVFPSIRVFPNESVLCIRWPKYWSFSISPSSDCLLLATVLGTACLKDPFVGRGKLSLLSAETIPWVPNGSGIFMQGKKKQPLPRHGPTSAAVGQGWFQSPPGSLHWCLCSRLTTYPALGNPDTCLMHYSYKWDQQKEELQSSVICLFRNTHWTPDLFHILCLANPYVAQIKPHFKGKSMGQTETGKDVWSYRLACGRVPHHHEVYIHSI